MTRNDNRDLDQQTMARAFHDRMRGLDAFIPSAPPLTLIERGIRPVGAGSRTSGSRVGPGLRAPVALLMVAVVVALGAAAVLVPRLLPPVAASPSGAPTASPLPSPSAAGPTAAPALSGRTIYRGFAGRVAWSPDGTKVAFADDADQRQIHVIGVDGNPIESLPGDAAAWQDDSSLVVLQMDGQAYVAGLGGGTRSPIAGKYKDLIGGSGGRIALLPWDDSKASYRIWSGGSGLSAAREGLPVAFSPDGSKLAVVHNPQPCCVAAPGGTRSSATATLDVTDVATGKSLATDPSVRQSGTPGYIVSFSPDGRRIAYLRQTPKAMDLAAAGILDIASAQIWTVAPAGNDVTDEPGEFLWLDNDHLEILPWASGTVAPGVPVTVSYGAKAFYAGATSSSGYVATIDSTRNKSGGLAGSPSVTISRSGSTRRLDLPATVEDLYWSPDGSTLLVACGAADGSVEWQLVLVRV